MNMKTLSWWMDQVSVKILFVHYICNKKTNIEINIKASNSNKLQFKYNLKMNDCS